MIRIVSFGKTLAARHGWLGGILLMALFLRVSGNLYDRGYGFHPDDHHYLGRAVEMMSAGTLNPGYFRNPPLYTYPILLLLYGLFAVQYALGQVASRAEFLAALPPPVAFGLARGLSAVAGTATCLLVYRIGRRFGGELAGSLAAGFYAVAFLSVRDAHFAANDIPVVAMVTLAFLFAVRFLEGGRTRDLISGGLTAGLAAATKYNGGIAVLPLLVACVLGRTDKESKWGTARVGAVGRRCLALGLLALVGFLLGNPYALLDPAAFRTGLTDTYDIRLEPKQGQSAAPVPLLMLRALEVELGWPLLLLIPLAAACCLARGGTRAKAAVLALSLVFPLLLYHASLARFKAHFLLPCTPLLVLLCAWGLVAVREASPHPWVRRAGVLGTALAVLVASPFARSVYLDVILHRSDTRLLAKAYLDRVAPPGSVIVPGWKLVYMPPLNPMRYRILPLSSAPALLDPAVKSADFYLFNNFDMGRLPENLQARVGGLIVALERLDFGHISFSPLRDGGEPPYEIDQVYVPYRHLFRYERPGPMIVIYSRPGIPVPPSSGQSGRFRGVGLLASTEP